MQVFHREDCSQTGNGIDLKNKVVVLSANVLPKEHSGQLFFCTGGSGANPAPMGSTVFLISLSDGEACRCERSDVVGTLEPELLPEEAKLQLSQIRPVGAADLHHHEPEYSGYSFLEDGRYAAGAWLCSPQEVMDYVEMQKPYQHRVLICDRDDFAVMEVVKEQEIFPTQKELEAFREDTQEQKGGGMEMK